MSDELEKRAREYCKEMLGREPTMAEMLADFARAEVQRERERLFIIREERKCVHETPNSFWHGLRDSVLDDEMGPFATLAEAEAALRSTK